MSNDLLSIACVGVMVACAGGQSGNEGDMPAPPCAGDGALLEAAVLSTAAGCVELEVIRVLKTGTEVRDRSGNVLFSGRTEPGERLNGKLGIVYTVVTSFGPGDIVAALPMPWSDMLEFQIMPSNDDSIAGRWGSNTFSATFADIASPQCAAILEERLVEVESSPKTSTQQTQAQQIPNCGVLGDKP
jgi:hypothetical protein